MHVARANLLTPLQCDPPSAGLRMTGATCLTYPHLIATNYYPLRDTLSIFVQLLGCQIDLDNRRCMYLLALSAPLALTTAAITSSNHSPSHLYSRIINHKCVYSRMHTWRAFSFPNKWPLILSISRFIGNSSYCGGQTATPLLQCRSPYIAILLNLTTIITCFVKFYWNSVQSKPWTLFFLEKLILIWNLQIGSMSHAASWCMLMQPAWQRNPRLAITAMVARCQQRCYPREWSNCNLTQSNTWKAQPGIVWNFGQCLTWLESSIDTLRGSLLNLRSKKRCQHSSNLSIKMLSERRKKVIYSNPRGTLWANGKLGTNGITEFFPLTVKLTASFLDDKKFGQKLLKSMGWQEGKGLGKNESKSICHRSAPCLKHVPICFYLDGITENVKASFKFDSQGFGYKRNLNHWIEENNVYEQLLEDLAQHHTGIQGVSPKALSSSNSSDSEQTQKLKLNRKHQ